MLTEAHSQIEVPTNKPYSPTHRQHRKYAKIICHLRDDVAGQVATTPDSACIHQLSKKYYAQAEEALTWEDAICKLLNLMKSDPICQSENNNYGMFFQEAIEQIRKATNRASVWFH